MWRGVVEVGALGRFAQDWSSTDNLTEEVWYPGAYASFALWGDLGGAKIGFDGYGEILSGEVDSTNRTNLNLGVVGAHLGVGDDLYAGIFGALAVYPNAEVEEQLVGGAIGFEGVATVDTMKLIGRLGYAYAPNEDFDNDDEGFVGLFVEGAVQFAVSDDFVLEANAGYGYSDTFDGDEDAGQYISWGLKAVYALPTEFDLNLVASYEGLLAEDLVDAGEQVVNHTFKIGLSIPFGGAGTASDSLNPLASPRAPFQASTLADVM